MATSPAAARELKVSGPDLRRLTWARPGQLEEAEDGARKLSRAPECIDPGSLQRRLASAAMGGGQDHVELAGAGSPACSGQARRGESWRPSAVRDYIPLAAPAAEQVKLTPPPPPPTLDEAVSLSGAAARGPRQRCAASGKWQRDRDLTVALVTADLGSSTHCQFDGVPGAALPAADGGALAQALSPTREPARVSPSFNTGRLFATIERKLASSAHTGRINW